MNASQNDAATRLMLSVVPRVKIISSVFGGHKIYGPTGIGVLYGKEEWLDRMPPYQGGGEMIESVSFEKTTFEKLPFKFEAGTPDYVATHGLATALNYVSQLGMDNIAAHERELTDYCMKRLAEIDERTVVDGARKDWEIGANLVYIVHSIVR
jgi:selenocysteine lyase/cysteine desulfurase